MGKRYFSRELFKFLKELRANNDREWFAVNKHRYESLLRDPFLQFIADFAPLLHGLSHNFVADPRPSGGSLFRIYRDIRFSADKSPYKTHASAQFPHSDSGEELNAPGFYLHLEPGGCFTAAGIWHPNSRTLFKVRTAITQRETEWQGLKRRKLRLEGDSLTRPPKGFSADHPLIEDLKRKNYVTSVVFSEDQVCSDRFLIDFAAASRKMSPLVEFLTRAVDLEW